MIIHNMPNKHKYNKQQTQCFISFIDSGVINAPKNWLHKERFLEKHELIYVTKGSLYIKIDDRNINLNENNVLIIPPYKTIMGVKESNLETTFYWVDFATDNSENFDINYNQTLINTSKFHYLIDELNYISKQKNISDYTKDSILLLLLYLINQSNIKNSPSHIIITKTCKYIDSNITKPLTVESIALSLNYNKDYLNKIIKDNFGITLKEYINNQKIKLVKNLLLTSNFTIKEIAEYIGYDDNNLFTKFFKYHEDISPSEYRKLHYK